MKYPYQSFKADFPNDDACLARLLELRYGKEPICQKCGKYTHFSPISRRRAFACQWCGHHVYPCAGTIFEKSSTPLSLWFHAMYLMTATRNGVSAKELERQLGVTYKCAWRIGHEIRKLMAQRNGQDGPMSGHVEVDESYFGGRRRGSGKRGPQGKTVVFGMLERGGNVRGRVVANVRRVTLRPIITKNVKPGSTISSDELFTYHALPAHGYIHGTVKHSAEQYVNGTHHVNGIEGFWKHLKYGIRSTHIHVSAKYLQQYVEEFGFRYNNRKEPQAMFYRMLSHLARSAKAAS